MSIWAKFSSTIAEREREEAEIAEKQRLAAERLAWEDESMRLVWNKTQDIENFEESDWS